MIDFNGEYTWKWQEEGRTQAQEAVTGASFYQNK